MKVSEDQCKNCETNSDCSDDLCWDGKKCTSFQHCSKKNSIPCKILCEYCTGGGGDNDVCMVFR